MEKLLHVSPSPHIRTSLTTKKIMWDVIIALLPATLFGIYVFKMEAVITIALSILACVLSEYVFEKLMKLPVTISDGSAIITGLLLALNLPSSVPFYIPLIGGIFAIVVVKMVYGGLGQNIMNPALAARCFLLIAFSARMTNYTLDGVTTATPLALIKAGSEVNLLDMFIGNIGGCIGETSVIAILIGGLYLIIKKVISIRIPLVILVSFSIVYLCFSDHQFNLYYLALQLCGGGLMLGAFFMATDYVTSPITYKGQVIYAIIIGVLIAIFRIFSSTSEGVSFAIIFTNLLVPLIEYYTLPKAFGKEGEHNEK